MIPISYSSASDPEKEYIKLIHEMASHVKYGSITITIQDGKIVQIEKIEKNQIKELTGQPEVLISRNAYQGRLSFFCILIVRKKV
uniref:DUF2292 domain-containing protein n=1 Tax=Clostridium sp. NkU-1 TaxID=1095009 RepID=UPI0006D17FA0